VEAQILEIQELELSAATLWSCVPNASTLDIEQAPIRRLLFLQSSRFATGPGGTARKSTVVVMVAMMVMPAMMAVVTVMPTMMTVMMPSPMHLGGL
jgi:hypothetical protein